MQKSLRRLGILSLIVLMAGAGSAWAQVNSVFSSSGQQDSRVADTLPPGWHLDAKNGEIDDYGTSYADFLSDNRIRVRTGNQYEAPYSENAILKVGHATNHQFKYDLLANNFVGNEIAMGVCLQVIGYECDAPGGDAVASLIIPGGPGIAIVAGKTGSTMTDGIPGDSTDVGLHLYQIRQSLGQRVPEFVTYGDADTPVPPGSRLNYSGAKKKIATLLTSYGGDDDETVRGSKNWKTPKPHIFWLYVNKATKRVMVTVDGQLKVDTVLDPLNYQFYRDPAKDFGAVKGIEFFAVSGYARPLPTSWDTNGYAQFGASDYDIHPEAPAWNQPTSDGPVARVLGYVAWQTGWNTPTPYYVKDNRIFFGGHPTDAQFAQTAAILTTNMNQTPFANKLEVQEILVDGSFEQCTNWPKSDQANPSRGDYLVVTPNPSSPWDAYSIDAMGISQEQMAMWMPGAYDATSINNFVTLKPAPPVMDGLKALVSNQGDGITKLKPDGGSTGAHQTVSVVPGQFYTLKGFVSGGIEQGGTASWQVGVINGPWDQQAIVVNQAFTDGYVHLAYDYTLTNATWTKVFDWGYPDPFRAPFAYMFKVPDNVNQVTIYTREYMPDVRETTGWYGGAASFFDDLSLVGPVPSQCSRIPWADVNGDGIVDMDDFAALQLCYDGGTNVATFLDAVNGYSCSCLDHAGTSGIVDNADVTAFMKCMSGPGIHWVSTTNCPN